MLKRMEAGFTLIETTIALAISSSLAILAFTGFNTMQKQLQFSAAVEGAKDFITSQRTEVNATIQTADTSGTPRGDSDTITFGRIMTITPNGLTTRTLRMKLVDAPADDADVEIATGDSNDIDYVLAWRAQFGASVKDRSIAFVRSPFDGSLQTYVSTGGDFAKNSNGHYRFDNFKNSATASIVSLPIIDETGRSASVIIDPKSNAVSRQFN